MYDSEVLWMFDELGQVGTNWILMYKNGVEHFKFIFSWALFVTIKEAFHILRGDAFWLNNKKACV